jgi:hypothetical protein
VQPSMRSLGHEHIGRRYVFRSVNAAVAPGIPTRIPSKCRDSPREPYEQRGGRGRDASYPAQPRTDPFVRDYLIRLLPRVKRVDAPKDKDDRCERVGTKPQSAVPYASRAGCVSGSDAVTLSTIPSEAYAGMRSMIVRSSEPHNIAWAIFRYSGDTIPIFIDRLAVIGILCRHD